MPDAVSRHRLDPVSSVSGDTSTWKLGVVDTPKERLGGGMDAERWAVPVQPISHVLAQTVKVAPNTALPSIQY